MKVLVIGASGQLGSDLVQVLQQAGETCIPVTGSDVDITQPDRVSALLDDVRPEAVVNCAAFHNVGGCEEDPDRARAVNADAVGLLARESHARGAKFLTLSSDYVFDGRKVEGYREEDEPNPLNVYGHSKLAGERLALENSPQAFVVRTQSLYGLTGPKGKGLNFVDLMIKLSGERDELKVDQCRQAPTSTASLAENLYTLLQSDDYGLYHMSCEGATTWFEFATRILELIGSSVKVTPVANDHFPRNFERPENTYLINERLRAVEKNQMPTWEDALRSYLKAKGYRVELNAEKAEER